MWSTERFRRNTEVGRVATRWRLNPGYMHSFAVTDNYYVLIEQPLCINVPKMAKSLLSTDKAVIDGMVWYGDTESTLIHAVPKNKSSKHRSVQLIEPYNKI